LKDIFEVDMKLYRNVKLLLLLTLIVFFVAVVVLFDEGENNISGKLTYTKAEIIPIVYKNCSFELYPGWNMVSFYCLGLFASRSSVLQTVGGSYSSIFEYIPNDIHGDPWKSYNPYLPNWTVQQLMYMDRVSGYWIYMNSAANFSYSGVYSDSVIFLYDGWNLVGYPNTESRNITIMLNGTEHSMVENYHKTTINVSIYNNITNITYNFTQYTGLDVWLVYINGSASNNLTNFSTYKGYWINVSGDQQWNVRRY
jgi:hypothetical protein